MAAARPHTATLARWNAHATRGGPAFDRPGRFASVPAHAGVDPTKKPRATAAFLTTRFPDQAASRFTIASAKLLVLPLPPMSGVTLSRSFVIVSRIAARSLSPLATMSR